MACIRVTSPHSNLSLAPKSAIVAGGQPAADFGWDMYQREAPEPFPLAQRSLPPSHTGVFEAANSFLHHFIAKCTFQQTAPCLSGYTWTSSWSPQGRDDGLDGKTTTKKYPSTLNFASGMIMSVLNFYKNVKDKGQRIQTALTLPPLLQLVYRDINGFTNPAGTLVFQD